jgi:hypothetical protein
MGANVFNRKPLACMLKGGFFERCIRDNLSDTSLRV